MCLLVLFLFGCMFRFLPTWSPSFTHACTSSISREQHWKSFPNFPPLMQKALVAVYSGECHLSKFWKVEKGIEAQVQTHVVHSKPLIRVGGQFWKLLLLFAPPFCFIDQDTYDIFLIVQLWALPVLVAGLCCLQQMTKLLTLHPDLTSVPCLNDLLTYSSQLNSIQNTLRWAGELDQGLRIRGVCKQNKRDWIVNIEFTCQRKDLQMNPYFDLLIVDD